MTDHTTATFQNKLGQNRLSISPLSIKILQVNITRKCNMACSHCHVEASPQREEMMDDQTVQLCMNIIRTHPQIQTVDITGGAPELHPHFKFFVKQVRDLQRQVIVRHNLTVSFVEKPGFGTDPVELIQFFADHQVELIASLPGWRKECVDHQRGEGIFDQSIKGLRLLNEQGYGKPDTGLQLNLIYNPGGAAIPGAQKDMEAVFRTELSQNFGIAFSHLYILNNFPINRFKKFLEEKDQYETYMDALENAFNSQAAENVMCRDQISVAPDGSLFDCDFNQMLNLHLENDPSNTVFTFDHEKLLNRKIVFGAHCFACTAGAGSSCTGQIA